MKVVEYILIFENLRVDVFFIVYLFNRIFKFKGLIDSMIFLVSRYFELEYFVNIFKCDDEDILEFSEVEIFIKLSNVYFFFYERNVELFFDYLFGEKLKLIVFIKDELSVKKDVYDF